ncbi:Solute carrier family 25 member 48, partial [Galemys pyrenaicus]
NFLEEDNLGCLSWQLQTTSSRGREPLSNLDTPCWALEYLPFFRTYGQLQAEEELALQPDLCKDFGDQTVREAPFSEDSAPPSGFFPYYRSKEDSFPSLALPGGPQAFSLFSHESGPPQGASAPAMGIFQLEDFAAGWIGGAASVIIGHPLDTVKARLQAGVGYGNTLNCIRTLYRRESMFGFFKGMSFPLASIAVYNSMVFGVFSNTERFLRQHHSREPEASPTRALSDLILASSVAGIVSVGLGTPVDLIKIRLQMQTQPFQEANLALKPRTAALGAQPAYQGPVHCIATIVRTEGLAGMYRGASAMLLRDIPGYCLYFIPYVFLNEWITPEAYAGPSPCAVWLAGGMAGAISWAASTPMDVMKSRLQADGVYLNKYKGVLDCISQSYQKEGLKVSPQRSCRASVAP